MSKEQKPGGGIGPGERPDQTGPEGPTTPATHDPSKQDEQGTSSPGKSGTTGEGIDRQAPSRPTVGGLPVGERSQRTGPPLPTRQTPRPGAGTSRPARQVAEPSQPAEPGGKQERTEQEPAEERNGQPGTIPREAGGERPERKETEPPREGFQQALPVDREKRSGSQPATQERERERPAGTQGAGTSEGGQPAEGPAEPASVRQEERQGKSGTGEVVAGDIPPGGVAFGTAEKDTAAKQPRTRDEGVRPAEDAGQVEAAPVTPVAKADEEPGRGRKESQGRESTQEERRSAQPAEREPEKATGMGDGDGPGDTVPTARGGEEEDDGDRGKPAKTENSAEEGATSAAAEEEKKPISDFEKARLKMMSEALDMLTDNAELTVPQIVPPGDLKDYEYDFTNGRSLRGPDRERLKANVGTETRIGYRELLVTNQAAAVTLAELVEAKLSEGSTSIFNDRQEYPGGSVRMNGYIFYSDKPFVSPENALYLLPPMKGRTLAYPTGVEVTTTEDIMYPDPDHPGQDIEAKIGTTFTFQIPKGENAQIRMVGIEWHYGDGASLQQTKDFLIKHMLEQDRDMTSLMEDPHQDVEQTILLRSAARQAKHYKETIGKNKLPVQFTTGTPSPVFGEMIQNFENFTREKETREAQEKILIDVSKLLASQPEGSTLTDRIAYGEGLIYMIELAYKIGKIDASQKDATAKDKPLDDNNDVMTVDKARGYLLTMLGEMQADLPDAFRVRALHLDAIAFKNDFALKNLKSLLDGEVKMLGIKKERGEQITEEDHSVLETVIRESERLGVDPSPLIRDFRKTNADIWVHTTSHAKRLHDAGKDSKNQLDAAIMDLLTPDLFTKQFVYDKMLFALSASTQPDIRKSLVERFIDAYDDSDVTLENFKTLVQVSHLALKDADPNTLENLDSMIRNVSLALPREIYDENLRATAQKIIDAKTFEWNVIYDTRTGVPPASIVNHIEDHEHKSELSRDNLLDTAADQYIASGNFAEANIVIHAMSFEGQMAAYVKYWGKAGTPMGFALLKPPVEEATGEVDPQLEYLYETAHVLHSQSPEMMLERATEVANQLRNSGAEADNAGALLGHQELHMQQIEQLLQRAESSGDKIKYQQTVRAIFTLFYGVGITYITQDFQKDLVNRITKTFGAKDVPLVQGGIISHMNQEDMHGNKVGFTGTIAELTDFALQIGSQSGSDTSMKTAKALMEGFDVRGAGHAIARLTENRAQEEPKEMSEREQAVQTERIKILGEAAKKVKELKGKNVPEDVFAEALIDMLELTAKAGNLDNKQILQVAGKLKQVEGAMTFSDAREQLMVMVHNSIDLSQSLRARAYFIEAEVFRVAHVKNTYEWMLVGERDVRALKPSESRKPVYLEAAVRESERLGLSATELIKKYGINEEEKWRMQFDHLMHRSPDVPEVVLNTQLRKLLGEYPDQFIFETIPEVMPLIKKDAIFRKTLSERFLKVMDKVRLTPETVGNIFNFGKEVMRKGETVLIKAYSSKLTAIINEPNVDVSGTVYSEGELHQVYHALAQGKFAWDMAQSVTFGVSPEPILEKIDSASEKFGFDRNAILDTVAQVYIAKGDYENMKMLLSHMQVDTDIQTFDNPDDAFLSYWVSEASAAQLSHKYVSTMVHAAKTLAKDIHTRVTVDTVMGKDQRWNKLTRLVKKVKEVAGEYDTQSGINIGLSLSSDILSIFSSNDGILDFENLEPIIAIIAQSGTSEVWELVHSSIDEQPLPESEKLRLYTEFALKLQ